MEVLKLYVRGEPKEVTSWKVNDIVFENGSHQYQQQWTEPEITVMVETSGDKSYIDGLIKFFNKCGGQVKPFLCDIYRDGNLKIYRFGQSKMEVKWAYAVGTGQKVGGTTSLVLLQEKGQWQP